MEEEVWGIEGISFATTLCERCDVERRDEFHHCKLCEVRSGNLALDLELKDVKEKL